MAAARRWLHIIVPLLMLAAAAVLRAGEPGMLERARLLVFDAYQRMAPRAYDPGLPVRIVDLDDASLERLGQWPWPRTLVARLVARLGDMGAAAIVFDMVFAEPDRTSPAEVLPLWPDDPAVEDLRRRLDVLPDHDRVLAETLARYNTVTGFAFVQRPGGRPPAEKGTFAIAGDDPRPFIQGFAGTVVNLAPIEAAAAGNGSFNTVPDFDNVTRRVPLIFRLGETLYPSLAAEALRVAMGAGSYIVKSSGASGIESFGAATGISQIKVGGMVAETDPRGRLLLYTTGPQPTRFLPAWRVLEPDFDPTEVAGRIVLIGTSAAGLKDLRATPLDPVAPGVEIHAEVIEQIVSGTFLLRPDMADGVELVALVALGLLLILLIPRLGARWCGLLGAGSLAAGVGASWYAFTTWGWLFDPLYPALVVVAIYVVETGIVFLHAESERRWVRGAFGRYLSPAVVSLLAADPGSLRLGGEMREMTLLFCDMRGFTTISEQFDAAGLTRFINRFLTPMTGVILSFGGTIDKYMGDAIMAFWGAPVTEARHARLGCEAALEMRRALAELNRRLAAEASAAGRGEVAVRVGIGLNTGVCCVGNMGSDQRFDYSVLGDDVNLASRLEGQSKIYGVDIVISESTRAAAGAGLATLELDLVRVKGKTRPVRIHALLGEATADDGDFAALSAAHAALLAAYRGQDWAGAAHQLAACRAWADGRLAALYDLYEARIAAFRAQPPGPDWDGVAIAETK